METLRALVTTGLVFDRLSTSWVQTRNAVVLATASAAAVNGTEHDGPLSALAQHCSLLSVPSPSYADVAALFKVRVASWLDSWLVATTATTAAMTDVVDLEDEFHISTSLFQSTLAPVVKLVAAANAFRRGTSVSTATTPLAAASLAASVANRISTDGSDGGRHALSFTTGLRTISGLCRPWSFPSESDSRDTPQDSTPASRAACISRVRVRSRLSRASAGACVPLELKCRGRASCSQLFSPCAILF